MKIIHFHTLTNVNGGSHLVWFWYFLIYSFFGFLLEVSYARITGGYPERKCLLVLPLCPVYGLGACAILLLAPVKGFPPAVFLLGGLAATAVEYGVSLFYEKALKVSFWDYRGLPGSIHGRICMPFSLAWGVLALPLIYWVHPALAPLVQAIPGPVSLSAVTAVGADSLISLALLAQTHDRSCLEWCRS